MNPDVTKSINQFCVAKKKIDKINDHFNEERRPVSQREREIKDNLFKWMSSKNIQNAKVGPNLYLLLKKSQLITPLNLDGIERAIMSITPDDLKNAHERLKTKSKRGTKRSKDGTSKDNPSVAINMIDIWEEAAVEKIRNEHVKQNTRLILKDEKQEKDSDSDDDRHNDKAIYYDAPVEIKKLAEEWRILKNQLNTLRKSKSESLSEYKKVIEEQEPVVCEYLDRHHPQDKSRSVILSSKEGQMHFTLKKKETLRMVKQVRITAFKPIIKDCISHVCKTYNGINNYNNACTNEIKHSIFAILSTQYVKFQESQKIKKEYASLDKVAVKKQN